MPKELPQRSCIACRQVLPKASLLRFVQAPDLTLVPDLQGKLPGRGAYTCVKRSCVQQALARKQFSRAFKGNVTLPPADELVRQVVGFMEARVTSYLALANKAGKIVSGNEQVMDFLRKGKKGVLVVASDISPDIGEKLLQTARRSNMDCFSFSTKDALGALLGKGLRSALIVTESGFLDVIRNEMGKYRNFLEGGAIENG
ncbi:MAG: DUF448 domain-containing protein [Geobacter sp.]|nr:DUF448 domain-containing protein [Geobacter sp.]